MKLKLAYYGDPILRKKGIAIETIDASIHQLVEDMIETMHAENGCGLAAPQVHKSVALFVTCLDRYQGEEVIEGKVKVFINPKILSYSEETWVMDEGCLSIPGVRGKVERPVTIKIQATDLEGNLFTETLSEMEARVFMHENDHINGVLYIDRMPAKKRKELEPFLKKIKKNI